MGEITLEKKKEIEEYIVRSYFGRCKNVESYIGGCDIVYGSKNDDIPDILVEVEDFSGSGFMVVRWNIIHDQVSEWQNEFIIRIARELSITRNRCNSVDAMGYAFVSWKKQLEEKTIFLKDKRIEELESEVKALKAEKEAMEARIQELEKRNEINKQMRDLYKSHLNEWGTATDCSTPEDAKKVFTAAKEEIRVQTDNAHHYREQLDGFVELYDELADKHKELESQIKAWKEATGFNTPDGAKEYWTAKLSESGGVSESLAMEVRSWKNATGCSTPEEVNKKLSSYEGRLDSVKQSASIAIRHLDNIVFRDDKRSDWSDK